MFESVLLPAPFSPSSACTSPTAASKSTPSFATTPGNRLVIPRMATAAPVGAAVASGSRVTSADIRLARGGAEGGCACRYPFGLPITPLTSQLTA